jgi:hypothetical protein
LANHGKENKFTKTTDFLNTCKTKELLILDFQWFNKNKGTSMEHHKLTVFGQPCGQYKGLASHIPPFTVITGPDNTPVPFPQ